MYTLHNIILYSNNYGAKILNGYVNGLMSKFSYTYIDLYT